MKIEGANCGNFGGCKIWQPANFAGCEISQVAHFRNLRNLAGCEFSQPANTAHACTCYLIFDPLVGGFIQVYPYVILILKHTFVISSLLSLYKLTHACNQINSYHSINQSSTKLPPSLLLVIFSPSPFTFLHFLGCQTPLMMTNQGMLG